MCKVHFVKKFSAQLGSAATLQCTPGVPPVLRSLTVGQASIQERAQSEQIDTMFVFAKCKIGEQPTINPYDSSDGVVYGECKTIDLKLPKPLQLDSETSERLILALRTGDHSEFVTIDFEWRRWQLGNHPLRILNPIQQHYQARSWQERLIKDGAQALLAIPAAKCSEDAVPAANGIAGPAEPELPWVAHTTAKVELPPGNVCQPEGKIPR